MHRIDTSTATSNGLFTEGDPLVPTPATVVSADWLNSVQEELAAIVTNAGLELQKADNTQVLTAILQIIARQSSELERLRLLKIGCPMYWRSTTLPAGHVWANGDLALFADWPELKKIYDAGGFAGMLLAYNANSATIAANLGKWRPNAANPTGLYVPNLSEQFFRAWGQGTGREAGNWQGDAMCRITGVLGNFRWPAVISGSSLSKMTTGAGTTSVAEDYTIKTSQILTFDSGEAVTTAGENRPVNVAVPVILYLGNPS